MQALESVPYTESRRAELRALVKLAGDIIPPLWPLRTAIAINPLVGLEELEFHDAIRRAQGWWGGRGYLPNEHYRAYYREGRITPQQVDATLASLAGEPPVTIGGKPVSHLDVLRAHFIHGVPDPAHETVDALVNHEPERDCVEALADRLRHVLERSSSEAIVQARVHADRAVLGHTCSLAQWCDQTLGVNLWATINSELIKWCAAYLDEGQAAWPMPRRRQTFYGAWKTLAGYDRSGSLDSLLEHGETTLAALPERAEDALLDSLMAMGLPESAWTDYLAIHLTALPGWAGFIKWRAEQPDPISAEWAKASPCDLVQYLAVRLWYEQELVRAACRRHLDTEGTVAALTAFMHRDPAVYLLRRERVAGRLLSTYAGQVDRLTGTEPSARTEAWKALADRYVTELDALYYDATVKTAAWRLARLAGHLEIPPRALLDGPPSELKRLLQWLDAFPEQAHGPRWLAALEAGFRDSLLERLERSAGPSVEPVPAQDVRPHAQAVFCIDARSERFRRHLEEIGDYQTLGFAGFFLCFIRFRAFGRHHDVNSFPVIMKSKNLVREIPRSVSGLAVFRYRAGARLIEAAHALFHDLKYHVITPYVMVESLGWFFALPFIGKTLIPRGWRWLGASLTQVLAPKIATTLTVNKLAKGEVEEMLAAEHRAVIRRALRERLGLTGSQIDPGLIDTLRREALEESGGTGAPLTGLSAEDTARFIAALRTDYGVSRRRMGTQMSRITMTGLTLDEQVVTVDTALRMMGLTHNFGRLVVFIGHGSTVDNNPYEAALECGACGGNEGNPNVRLLAAMANNPDVRRQLEKKGIYIPEDTRFIGGRHDTCTDAVQLFDLEDVPTTHRKDLVRLIEDLAAAGRQTAQERLAQLPDIAPEIARTTVETVVRQRSADWSQVRPEWGLARNAAVVVGRRRMTRGVHLDGRVFLHSYDYTEDPTGKLLEIILTAPGQVMEWINLGYYFSTVDNETYGAGNKIYHNVVGHLGVMVGTQSDLRIGLPWQSVMVNDERPYHEPVRLLVVVEAPRDRVTGLIERHPLLQRWYDHGWVHLVLFDPEERRWYRYRPTRQWDVVTPGLATAVS